MFTRQHFNAIAKDIRTEIEPLIGKREENREDRHEFVYYQGQISALVNLALRFGKRFEDERKEKDAPEFDVLAFMDACSPDPEKYPFSELWMGREG